MTSSLQKGLRPLLIALCILGSAAAIAIGAHFFKGRVFWIFSVYILLLAGLVFFFGTRLARPIDE